MCTTSSLGYRNQLLPSLHMLQRQSCSFVSSQYKLLHIHPHLRSLVTMKLEESSQVSPETREVAQHPPTLRNLSNSVTGSAPSTFAFLSLPAELRASILTACITPIMIAKRMTNLVVCAPGICLTPCQNVFSGCHVNSAKKLFASCQLTSLSYATFDSTKKQKIGSNGRSYAIRLDLLPYYASSIQITAPNMAVFTDNTSISDSNPKGYASGST